MSFRLMHSGAGLSGRLKRLLLSGLLFAAVPFAANTFGATSAEAKIPGHTYCFKRVCHRVKTLAETRRLVGEDTTLLSTHYDDCRRDRYNPCGLTSSGERFDADSPDNAASPIYPNGTVLLLRNPKTRDTAVVRINNTGPFWGRRNLDVSRAAAEKLGFRRRGVAKLEARIISAPTRAEARYKHKRRYAAVAGPIGKFASLDRAQGGMMVAAAMNSMSGSLFAPAASKMLPALKSSKTGLAKALRGESITVAANSITPAEALRRAARRLYGDDTIRPSVAPSSVLASYVPFDPATESIAPIHRSRRRAAAL